MTLLYRTFQKLGWARYMVAASVLLTVAAAPALLTSIPNHTFSIPENAAAGTLVGTIAPSSDGDGDPLHFALVSGNTGGAFALEASGGTLRVANTSALNYEATPSFTLGIVATAKRGTEAEQSTSLTVTVQLQDVAELPGITAFAATTISEKGATLGGRVTANGAATTYALQWGLSAALPEVAPASLPGAQTLSVSAGSVSVSQVVNGLLGGTTYYYRLLAQNSEGVVYGETLSFTTLSVPKLVSITRTDKSPTNAKNLGFTVRFSEPVQGIDAADFVLSFTGTARGAIGQVQVLNAYSYRVQVQQARGVGKLRLGLKESSGIVSQQNVPLGMAPLGAESDSDQFQPYLLDDEAPTITITGPSLLHTQVGPATWVVTYSEPVAITLSPADITVIATGTAAGTVEVSGTTNTQRVVRIKNTTGDGTLKFSIAAGTATDEAGNFAGAAGPSNHVVVDNTPPVAVCPDPIVVNSANGSCDAYVTVPLPEYSDNTPDELGGVFSLPNDYTNSADASAIYPVGTTVVTWVILDAALNYTTCSTTITVLDATPPVVSCPSDFEVGTDAGSCQAVVEYDVPYTDNCSGATITQLAGLPSGAVFPLGETRNEFKIVDGKGNETLCSFTVTVVDNKAPVIVCPADIIVDVESGRNGAEVPYDAITATDNCTAAGALTITQTAGLASGSFFPSGTTINTFVVRDAAGNESTCSFSVTVSDDEAPWIVISDPSVWLTQTGPVWYDVTYYAATTITLSAADISLNRTGTANAGAIVVEPIAGTTNKFRVTLSSISGNGSISISIAAGTASDNVGNMAPKAGPSDPFWVDTSGPGITAIGDVTTLEDTPTGNIDFEVTDEVTPSAELQVSVTAADAVLVPASGIRLTGTGRNRRLVITPGLHRHGVTQITITVTDNAGLSSSRQFQLTVVAVADAPVVTTEPAFGPEDTWIGLTFSAALVDTDGSESLQYYLVENVPAGASLNAGTHEGDGVWRLTPAQLAGISVLPPLNFVGQFTLRIRAASQESSNGSLAVSPAVDLVVTVGPVNDAPSFSLSQTAIVRYEDFADDVVINILDLQDPDTNLSDIRFSLDPASVSWVNISIDPLTGEIVLKSVRDQNQNEPFTFTVIANDGSSENAIATRTFTVRIIPVNDAPSISIESPWVHQEDFTGAPTRSVVLAPPPADEVGETITWEISPAPESLNFINLSFSEGTFTATAVADAFGEATLSIRAFDGTDYSTPIEFKVIVVPVNDAPSISIESPWVHQEDFTGAPTRSVVLAAGPANEAGETITYEVTPDPASADFINLSFSEGTFTATAVADAHGQMEFSIRAFDGTDYSAAIPFTVIVQPVNDAPGGPGDGGGGGGGGDGLGPFTYLEDELAILDLNDYFTDPDGDVLQYTFVDMPAWFLQGVSDNGLSGLLQGTPDQEDVGDYSITVTVSDGEYSLTTTFMVHVIEVNDPPQIHDLREETETFINQALEPLTFTVSDEETPADQLEVDAHVLGGTSLIRSFALINEGEGAWRIEWSLQPNAYGVDTVQVRVTDEDGLSTIAKSVIKVGLQDLPDVPNLITPNGDGLNDSWNILGLEEFRNHEIRVFDVRGRLVFSSRQYGPSREWDGSLNGNPLPDGTYTYQILLNDGKEKRAGHITIAR
jgi:gliding motility-associated-like protein